MQRSSIGLLAVVLTAVVTVTTSAPALGQRRRRPDPAQDEKARKEAEARTHYNQGVTHYNLGEFDKAVASFKAAYQASGAPGLLFNLAQAYRLNKEHEQALYSYRTYLRLVPEAQNRADVEARVAELEKLVASNKRDAEPAPVAAPVTAPAAAAPAAAPAPSGPPPESTAVPAGHHDRMAAPPRPEPAPGSDKRMALAAPSVQPSPGVAQKLRSSLEPATTLRGRSQGPGPLGGLLRADVDGNHYAGADLVIGATYALGRLDIGLAALVNPNHQGVWVGATYFFLVGGLRPTLTVGAPVFFADGANVGVQAALGLQLQLGAHLGLRLEAGGATFPGSSDYESFVFVPALGLHARL